MRKLYICFILVTSIFLSACVSSNSESTSVSAKGESESKKTISIYWWGNQVRNDLTQKVVELYMKENPDIEIKAEFTDWSGYWDKLAASTTGGNMPDIIQMDYSYLTQYADSGQLAALDQYIENGLINTSDVADSVIDSGTINGKMP